MPDRGRDRRSPAGLVEAALGAPPAEWTAEMLARLCEERGIRLVTLLHVGGDGLLKGLDFVPRDGRHLRAVLSSGERADGSSLFRDGGIRAGKSDVVLLPRPDRAFLDPFPGEPALAVLCGHRDRDGAPLAVSPDTVVRRAHARLREETGLDLHAHGEVEYFLGRLPGEDGVQGTSERGYHAVAPAVFGEPLRRRAMVMLAGMGAPLKYGHGEVGFAPPEEGDPLCWEQHEIELGLAPLPEAADAVLLAQWVLRRLAREEGMRVSFEPVLRAGHAGNGLHFHCAFRGGARTAEGEEPFDPVRAPGGGLTDPARWLVGGFVRHGDALMAFGNRRESSFLRLRQAREAPSRIAWGEFDRSALVRIPVVPLGADGRPVAAATVEFRLPDGSAHPHLLLAAMAQCVAAARGAKDLEELLSATRAGAGAHSPLGTTIPRSFAEVGEALSWHRGVLESGGVFPPSLLDALLGTLSGGGGARPAG